MTSTRQISFILMFNQTLIKSILQTFKQSFVGCDMRFGRTKKISHVFKGIISDISWTDCKRKGGGFTIWVTYKDITRPHNIILKQMVDEYVAVVEEMKKKGIKLKSIRNRTINASKDLEVCFKGEWKCLDEIFPIEVRELRNHINCKVWTNKYTMNKNSILFLDLLYKEYEHISQDILIYNHT